MSRLWADRLYKSGTACCAWRWTDVDSEYIVRLHLLKTPFGALCLHWLKKPDPEPFDHDHPVSFLSIILRGRYVERRNGVLRERQRFNFIHGRSDDAHTIVSVAPNTLTLCLMGPKTRDWGYHLPTGWLGWKDYNADKRAARTPQSGTAI